MNAKERVNILIYMDCLSPPRWGEGDLYTIYTCNECKKNRKPKTMTAWSRDEHESYGKILHHFQKYHPAKAESIGLKIRHEI